MEDFSDDKTIILQIRVYFSTLEVTKITETKKWDTEDIMVGLGGTLSLFLGISFVAAIDYTASNGNPSSSSSLHYLGNNNQYESAIYQVG